MKKLSGYGLLLLAAVGCGSKTDPAPATVAGQNAAAPAGAAKTATTPSSVVTNGAGTEPGEVVALFLDSLRRGDENAANRVLTAQAQTELAKTDYVIQPLGTPEGKYTIGRVGFVDGDTSAGLVECMWSEPSPEPGQPPIEMEIVCEVHKEAAGWRISGLAVKMAGTEETFVLDFENAQSLQQALEGASGQPAPGTAAPAQNVAAQPLPGQPLPGQPLPGQPLPGQQPAGQQFSGQQPLPQPATGQQTIPAQPASFAMPPLPSAPAQPGVPFPGAPLPAIPNAQPAAQFNLPPTPTIQP